MLKDRYKFSLTINELNTLFAAIQNVFVIDIKRENLHLMLPVATLVDFHARLQSKMIFPAPMTKIFLKRTEAIAFLLLYKHRVIESTNETQQIATAIDRTV